MKRYGWHTSKGRELFAYGRSVTQAASRVDRYLERYSPREYLQYAIHFAEPGPVIDERRVPGS